MEWKNNIKVAQLGAFVAQKTDYKHGEQNLFDTIIKMAQTFVGANNIPLLEEDGQLALDFLEEKMQQVLDIFLLTNHQYLIKFLDQKMILF